MTRAKPPRPARARLSPMAVTDGFRSFVLDQLDELGEVTARSMFGGVGLYQRGIFFGLIAGDVLYLKVDAMTRPEYERMGMEPFRPYPDRSGTMQYYAVPIEVLESGIELTGWARKAVAVAERAGAWRRRARRRSVSSKKSPT
jgi:DNA transformation protein